MIRSVSLNHGLRYVLRLHESKLDLLNSFSELRLYLNNVFDGCHEDIFVEGPRSSALKFKLGIEPVRVAGHEVCSWAEQGLASYSGTPHEKVQLCMLENDSKTLAIEVPIWIKEADLVSESVKMDKSIYQHLFDKGCILTGHIDILSLDGNQIWVWDYKPGADREKYAATQVFFYALMLSKRSGIPLSKFRCGYFDDKVAYLFKPTLSIITAGQESVDGKEFTGSC